MMEMRANKNTRFLLAVLAALNLGFAPAPGWQKISTGILEPQINHLLADPQNNNTLYVATPKALYLSHDRGHSYEAVLQIQGSEKAVNYLYQPPAEPNVYVATDSGLYVSADQGKNWQHIFNPGEEKARRSFAVLKDGDTLYAGTLNGLYIKYQNNPSWQRESGDLGNTPIYKILADDKYYYFVNDRRLFRKKKAGGEIKVIFDGGLVNNEEKTTEDEDIAFPTRQIKDLVVVAKALFIGTNNGISYSFDQGQTWKALPLAGLPADAITSLVVNQNNDSHGKAASLEMIGGLKGGWLVYVGTTKGVFYLKNNYWMPLYKGLETTLIQALAQDSQGTLYAATDSGIFFMPYEKTLALMYSSQPDNKTRLESDRLNLDNFEQEPTIRDVQRLAIDYAEVSPDKIKQWRSGAQRRAILPTLSVGLDRSATDYLHWDTGPNPDKLMKGRDFMDWDLTLSWDLGDIIWNPDQTSIDSRSKLMVELREDLMDQVTRLYFERRRLQMEMVSASADQALRIDQEMRLAELTALIDALTGGQFSERIKNFSN